MQRIGDEMLLVIVEAQRPESLGGREFRTDMLTERILARPESLRETLADDHHAARLIGIVIAERTAAEDRDAQSAKVIGTDHPEVRVGPFAWRAGRPPLNAEMNGGGQQTGRRIIYGAGGFDSGQRLDAPQYLVEKVRHLLTAPVAGLQ